MIRWLFGPRLDVPSLLGYTGDFWGYTSGKVRESREEYLKRCRCVEYQCGGISGVVMPR